MTKDNKGPAILHVGKYQFEPLSRRLTIDSLSIILPNNQAKILKYLIEHSDQVATRDEMVTAIWGVYDYFKGRSMDVSISYLRKALRFDKTIRIANVFGIGFKLQTGVTDRPKPGDFLNF